jgi:N-acetylmuramoyl-L-alanine amidase
LLATSATASNLTGMSAEAAGDGVRVTLRFDAPFDAASAFAMTGPERFVVEVPDGKTAFRSVEGTGSVAKLRAAPFGEDRARIVVDLAAPMKLGATSAADNALVLTFTPADATAFRRQIARGRQPLPGMPAAQTAAAKPAAARPAATAEVKPAEAKPVQVAVADKPAPPPAPAAKSTPPATPAARPLPAEMAPPRGILAASASASSFDPQPAATPSKRVARPARGAFRPLVVIDAGHGGHDVGAISVHEGRFEKDATLAIARAIGRELEGTGKFRVLLTRSDDRFIPLTERVRIAQAARANLFISIHADSAQHAEARGASVYTLSEVASDREAARLAAKENKAGLLGSFRLAADSADVADVLFSLAQRETMNVSAEFATTLQREMEPEVDFRSHAHRFAGFAVLKAADVPSVLLETGFMSNLEDSKFLFSESGQKTIARGVREAVEAHFERRIAAR